jgi:hypothetical protein
MYVGILCIITRSVREQLFIQILAVSREWKTPSQCSVQFKQICFSQCQVRRQPQCMSLYSALQDAMPNQSFRIYSSRTAKAAAIAPTLYPTTLAAPVVSAGGALVSVALGATLGPPVCVGTVELPPFVGMADPVLAAPPPDGLNVIMVVTDTVSFDLVSELLHSMLPSWTGFVAMSAGDVELKTVEPGSLPSASLNAWQVRVSIATSEERRISRPQTDLSSVVVC